MTNPGAMVALGERGHGAREFLSEHGVLNVAGNRFVLAKASVLLGWFALVLGWIALT
jgi:hypothetical protein